MYSDKENINILTALLVAHGVRHAVVCPGSRNAPIVHNLNETKDISCLPVTDERSAGFQALGIAQATRLPVVVCVTSGTALLNLAPAVAEAFYQQIPLVVVSADRPRRWIDQLDGQTLPQEDALRPFVRKAVALPAVIVGDEERWYCNRLVNEALLEAGGRMANLKSGVAGPVHVNVPIEEPLFDFNTPNLPHERVVGKIDKGVGEANYSFLEQLLRQAERPMVVVGQHEPIDDGNLGAVRLKKMAVVVAERLAGWPDAARPVDETLTLVAGDVAFMPDTIFYFGGTLVSKRLKQFLRKAGEKATVVQVAPDGQLRDVTMHLDYLCVGSLQGFIAHLGREAAEDVGSINAFHQRWEERFAHVRATMDDECPSFSQLAVVRYFEQQLEDMEYPFHLHYANSMPVRLANSMAGQHVWCNRGVNGIEGSLSTAAGFSTAVTDKVFCVIGDLSFFYDQNALWNQNLRGNLRIILLNNGQGGIFNSLPGLEQSPAREALVAAKHHTTAQGICTQNDVGYLKADNTLDMQRGIVALLTENRSRPMLLEVFTDPESDAKALKTHFNSFDKRP